MGDVSPVDQDDAVYRRLSTALRVGVAAGLVPVVAGFVLSLLSGAAGSVAFPGVRGLFAGLLRGDAASLIFFGVVVVLALPPLQALLALLSYRGQGNRRFALAALGVLLVQAGALAVVWTK